VSPGDPGFVFGEGRSPTRSSRCARPMALRRRSTPYTPPNAGAPGVWVPTPPAFRGAVSCRAGGLVRTWVLESGAQFRPDEGPDLTSERYARD
jgi:hypothetical protein